MFPRKGFTRTVLSQLLIALEERLFAGEDARARARGWEVSRRPGGGRRYRDPRWDQVAECPECAGTGLDGVHVCERCDGRCTVRLDAADLPGGV